MGGGTGFLWVAFGLSCQGLVTVAGFLVLTKVRSSLLLGPYLHLLPKTE